MCSLLAFNTLIPYTRKKETRKPPLGKINSMGKENTKSNKILPFLGFLYKSHHRLNQGTDTGVRKLVIWEITSSWNFPRCELNLTCSLFHLHQHKRANLTWRIEFSMSFNPGITIGGTDNFKGNIFAARHKNCEKTCQYNLPRQGYHTSWMSTLHSQRSTANDNFRNSFNENL